VPAETIRSVESNEEREEEGWTAAQQCVCYISPRPGLREKVGEEGCLLRQGGSRQVETGRGRGTNGQAKKELSRLAGVAGEQEEVSERKLGETKRQQRHQKPSAERMG
jgi:hypothetical protein